MVDQRLDNLGCEFRMALDTNDVRDGPVSGGGGMGLDVPVYGVFGGGEGQDTVGWKGGDVVAALLLVWLLVLVLTSS